jgi:hypothetical protein
MAARMLAQHRKLAVREASSRSASVVDGLDLRDPQQARVLCGSTYGTVKVSTLAGLFANFCFTPAGGASE